MNDPLYNKLREAGWRRKLSSGEQAELRAWLLSHPDDRAEWEAEAGLNEILYSLADAPVATNFTARVLNAVQRDTAPGASHQASRFSWRWLLPKAAAAALGLGIAAFSYGEYRHSQRERIAGALLTLSSVATTPSAENIRDFKAISSLSQPGPDEELLRLLTMAN